MDWQKTQKTYFLLAPSEGLVKIGTSNDPMGRMKDLRTMNAAAVEVLVVLHGSRVPESDMHIKFKHLRHHGEWFQIDHSMVRFMEGIGETEAAKRLYGVKNDILDFGPPDAEQSLMRVEPMLDEVS